MASIKIPTPLRQYTGSQAVVAISGTNVGEGLQNLIEQYPDLRQHLYDGDTLRSFVNIFLGDEDIRYLQELNTPIDDHTKLRIIPAIAGG